MSLVSILEKAVSSITNFISHILPSSKKMLDVALVVVNGLKAFVDSPAADIITAIIPGDADDRIKDIIRAKLPVIIADLKLADAEAGKTADQIVKDGAAVIQGMPVKVKSVILQGIWQLLSDEITQSGVDLASLQKIGQTYYEESKV